MYDKGGGVESDSTAKAANKTDIRDQDTWDRIRNFWKMKKDTEQTALDTFGKKTEHNGPADAMRNIVHNAKMR